MDVANRMCALKPPPYDDLLRERAASFDERFNKYAWVLPLSFPVPTMYPMSLIPEAYSSVQPDLSVFRRMGP